MGRRIQSFTVSSRLHTSPPLPSRLQDLLRSALPDSMESALGGDERCVLDTMRLVDLLLVLLFEGRKALPKSTAGSTGRIPGLRRLDSSGERSHRQLIDCIRSKDTDALIDAIDTGGKNGRRKRSWRRSGDVLDFWR